MAEIRVTKPDNYDENTIIISTETNAPLMAVMYAKGLAANEDYMTLAECKAVTNEQLNGLLNANTTVVKFNEFQYFTGITKIGTSDDANESKTTSPFKGCTSLKEITLPKSATELGARAFDLTRNIEQINGLSNIHKFGYCCLQASFGNVNRMYVDCLKIDELKGELNFNNYYDATNYNIKNVVVSEGITKIGKGCFTKNLNIESVTLPNSLTTLGEVASSAAGAFNKCGNIKRINSSIDGYLNLPNNVTSIGNECFYSPNPHPYIYIHTINLPDSVEYIGRCSFGGFYNCDTLNIGSGVTSMGEYPFNTMGKDVELLTITIKAVTPPTLEDDLGFADDIDYVIYVPSESVEAYKAASGWSTYADKIFPIE